MKKVILMSIQPKWLAKILSGEKTIEIRKTMPKCELPIDVYLYCCKQRNGILNAEKDTIFHELPYNGKYGRFYVCNGKIVAKFTLKKVEKISYQDELAQQLGVNNRFNDTLKRACLTVKELADYTKEPFCNALHISDLVIFDQPMELGSFYSRMSVADFEFKYDCEIENVEPDGFIYQPTTKVPQSFMYAWVEEQR